MNDQQSLRLPAGISWQSWVQRWDRMQERCLARRDERISLLVSLVGALERPVRRVLDLGCGTGSLMQPLLESLPAAEVYGIDFDPLLLPLARERLRPCGDRARLVLADLRARDWYASVPEPVDAVVSATALHWLRPQELSVVYRRLARLLRPGGVFLNADHVASGQPWVQEYWELQRERQQHTHTPGADDWEGFWTAYTTALGFPDRSRIAGRVLGGWDGGVEEGMPLEWHFTELTAGGFQHPECFWRCDGDAIYGAFA